MTRSSVQRIAPRSTGSVERSGKREGTWCHRPDGIECLTYWFHKIVPLGARSESSRNLNPRTILSRSACNRATTGPANTQGGTSRPLPGTWGNFRTCGAACQPVIDRTDPTPLHPNLGVTTKPEVTCPVMPDINGIAPARPDGYRRRVGPWYEPSKLRVSPSASQPASLSLRNDS